MPGRNCPRPRGHLKGGVKLRASRPNNPWRDALSCRTRSTSDLSSPHRPSADPKTPTDSKSSAVAKRCAWASFLSCGACSPANCLQLRSPDICGCMCRPPVCEMMHTYPGLFAWQELVVQALRFLQLVFVHPFHLAREAEVAGLVAQALPTLPGHSSCELQGLFYAKCLASPGVFVVKHAQELRLSMVTRLESHLWTTPAHTASTPVIRGGPRTSSTLAKCLRLS